MVCLAEAVTLPSVAAMTGRMMIAARKKERQMAWRLLLRLRSLPPLPRRPSAVVLSGLAFSAASSQAFSKERRTQWRQRRHPKRR